MAVRGAHDRYRRPAQQYFIGLEVLLALPGLRLDREASEPPSGYEFRQPRRLTVSWD